MPKDATSNIDPERTDSEETAALRQAIAECYCGLGPACYLWRQLSPDNRIECSFDKRATAQRMWKNGM